MCRRAGCCAANDPDYCCLPPRHSRCMLGAQFPSRAAICHPCPSTHTHTLPPLPFRTCISHSRSIGGTLSANDRCRRTSLFLLLICHLALLQLDSLLFRALFFKRHTASPRAPTPQKHTHALPPLRHLKTEEHGDVSFTTKVETHPHRHLLLLLFRHGVNTNEEEMSPLLCPHLSQRPSDMHTHPCLSVSASLTLPSHTCSVISSNVMQCLNRNIIITSLAEMVIVFGEVSFELGL